MTKKVAFIIVCWNNADLLQECLESIKLQTYRNHLTILVDNGSADNSVETARHHMPEANIIEAKANLGFAKGNNIGIKRALEDSEVGYIALLNTDARLAPDWLTRIVDFCDSKPRAACLQGTTLDYYNHDVIDSTHIYVSRNSQATQGSWRDPYYSEFGPKKVFGVNAAAAVLTRSFLETQPFGSEIFDETMFMYLEDVDLAARATVMGWDNYCVPGARAYHMGSASSGKNPGFSLYLTFRNNLGMILKNFPLKTALRLLMSMPRSDYHTFRHLRRQGRQDAAWKIMKGRLASLRYIPIFLWKRHKLARFRRIDANYLWQLMKQGY
jgi:GT2 family glycosyltransferase